MKVKHYICPRACGKTTLANNLQKKDSSLLLIQCEGLSVSIDSLIAKFRGQEDARDCYTGIIIDEFIPITKHRDYHLSQFQFLLDYLGIEEVILISTPDKLYNSSEFDRLEMQNRLLLSSKNIEVEVIRTNLHPTHKFINRNEQSEEFFQTQILGNYKIL